MHGLGLIWSVPFVLTLLAIALGPLFLKEIWEKHSFKILLICPTILGIGMTINYNFGFFLTESINSILHHYVPLISLLFALFTVTGGIYISVNKAATPLLNTAMLFISSLLAGWIGTTGAAMLFIRPLLNINKDRKNVTHIVIFFIFLVANIGGGFTPIGDPPLLMGFIEGVDFFWTLKHIGLIVLTTIVVLCTIFYFIDNYLIKKENFEKSSWNGDVKKNIFKIDGFFNIFCLTFIIFCVIISGIVSKGEVSAFGIKFDLCALSRDLILVIIGVVSLKFSSKEIRKLNAFSFSPLKEVAEIFIAIFITLIPVAYMLQEGSAGAFVCLFDWASDINALNPLRCFFATGLLSSFLDNAPTYLIFFNLGGGNANILMNELSVTLSAISIGAVFFGAMTYIGNAPNFMVRSIAVERGIRMPSFFGYMGWSMGILLPYFFLLSYICFN